MIYNTKISKIITYTNIIYYMSYTFKIKGGPSKKVTGHAAYSGRNDII